MHFVAFGLYLRVIHSLRNFVQTFNIGNIFAFVFGPKIKSVKINLGRHTSPPTQIWAMAERKGVFFGVSPLSYAKGTLSKMVRCLVWSVNKRGTGGFVIRPQSPQEGSCLAGRSLKVWIISIFKRSMVSHESMLSSKFWMV